MGKGCWKKSRILSVMLTVAMVFSLLPVGAVATTAEPPITGVLVCHAEHDVTCGFVAEVADAICSHSCEACVVAEEASAEVSAYDKVVALFQALPEASVITEGMTEVEKEPYYVQVEEAKGAFDALSAEEQEMFEAEHGGLYVAMVKLGEVLMGTTAVPMEIQKRTTTLDLNTMTTTDNLATEGWKWDTSGNKTLTLNGANFDVASGFAIVFPKDGYVDVDVIGNNVIRSPLGIELGWNQTMFQGSGNLSIVGESKGVSIWEVEGGLVVSEAKVTVETTGAASKGVDVGRLLICDDGELEVKSEGTAISAVGMQISSGEMRAFSNTVAIHGQIEGPLDGSIEGLRMTGAKEELVYDYADYTQTVQTEPVIVRVKKMIKFDSRKGEASISNDIDEVNLTVTEPADPTWEGHTFVDWYTDIDGKGTKFVNENLTKSATVYAKWTKIVDGKTMTVRTEHLDLTKPVTPVSDQGWIWDDAKKELTLTNATIIGGEQWGAKNISLPATATIVLVGQNVVGRGDHQLGIGTATGGKLTISGEGSLDVKGNSWGMNLLGDLDIESGTIVVTGSLESYAGINATGKNVTIKGGSVTATGGKAIMGNVVATGATIKGGADAGSAVSIVSPSTDLSSYKYLNFSFGPSISVGTQVGEVIYGAGTAATFAVSNNNFGGTDQPVFAPTIDWGTTSHDGITATVTENKTVTITTTATAKAGEYKFKVVSPKASSETGNYASADVTFTIDKADFTPAVPMKEIKVQNGAVRTGVISLGDIFGATIPTGAIFDTVTAPATVNVMDAVTKSSDGTTVSYTSKSNEAESIGTDSYTVTIKTTNYNDITTTITFKSVDKTEATVDASKVKINNLNDTTKKKTYNNTDSSYTGAPTAKAGDTTLPDTTNYTYTWQKKNSGTDTYNTMPTGTTPKDAGDYKLVIAIDDGTYAGQGEILFTIEPAVVTVGVGTYKVSKVYDGGTTAGTASGALTVTGILEADKAKVSVVGTIPTYGAKTAATSTLDLGIALSGEGKGNYTLNTVDKISVPAEITKKPVTIEGGTLQLTKVYDGTTAAATKMADLAASGAVAGDKVYVANFTIGAYPSADVGTHTVLISDIVLTGDDKDNYSLGETTYNFIKATITKAEYTGSKTATKTVKAGKTGAVTVTLPALPTDAVYADIGTSETAWVTNVSITGTTLMFTATNPADKATGTITVGVSGAKNYKNYDVTVSLTAKAKDEVTINVTEPPAKPELVYTGAPQKGIDTGSVSVAGDKVSVADLVYTYTDEAGNSTTTAPTNAGTYTLVISVADSNETFMGETDAIEFTIEKASITVKANDQSMTINGTLPTPVVTYTGMVGGDTEATVIDTKAVAEHKTDGKTLGSFAITLKTEATLKTGAEKNYKIASQADGTLTVKEAGAPSVPSGGNNNNKPSVKPEDKTEVKPEDKLETKPETPATPPVLPKGEEVVDGNNSTNNIDQTDLNNKLANAENGSTVAVTVENKDNKDNATAQFVVQNVADMAKKDMILSVSTGDVIYELPTTAVDIDAIQEALGADVNLSEAPISITISKTAAETTQALETVATENGFALVIPPVDFTITATYGDQSVAVTTFTAFVPREIKITAEQAKQITTAVVYEADGTVRHVPTYVYEKDGQWFAKISSTTNSTYALIFNNVSFADASGQWYEGAVNEMGSRKIIGGVGENQFAGDRSITRAEFTAILVKALGLPATGKTTFTDVNASDWFAGSVSAAADHKIIGGRADGSFDPNAKISRQEAMSMVYRASKLTSYRGEDGSLSEFNDAAKVASFAKEAAAWSVGSGIMVGANGELRPEDQISRAETASIILRLLQKAELVDRR